MRVIILFTYFIKNQKHFFCSIVIWEIKTPGGIEWENLQMIPMGLDDYETSIDLRFVIFEVR